MMLLMFITNLGMGGTGTPDIPGEARNKIRIGVHIIP